MTLHIYHAALHGKLEQLNSEEINTSDEWTYLFNLLSQ